MIFQNPYAKPQSALAIFDISAAAGAGLPACRCCEVERRVERELEMVGISAPMPESITHSIFAGSAKAFPSRCVGGEPT